MKIIAQKLLVCGFIFSVSLPLFAQVNSPTSAPKPTPYSVVKRDANSAVWERTTYEKAPDGTVVPHVHKYTELATGLNFKRNGQYIPSKEEIDILPDGTCAAIQGRHRAYFPSDIARGVIEVVTPD